jgi:hypothetical protein
MLGARRKEGRRGLIAWRWSSHGLCVGSNRNAIYLYVTMKHCLFLPSKIHLSPPSSENSRLPRSFDALPGKSQTFQYISFNPETISLYFSLYPDLLPSLHYSQHSVKTPSTRSISFHFAKPLNNNYSLRLLNLCCTSHLNKEAPPQLVVNAH